MFFRIKKSAERAYLQVVEYKRVDGAVRQSVIAESRARRCLGGVRRSCLPRTSGAKLCDTVMLIDACDKNEDNAFTVSAKRIGGPLLFGKLWEVARHRQRAEGDAEGPGLRVRCRTRCVCRHASPVFVSGSDRDCVSSTLEVQEIPGIEGLSLHDFLPRHGLAR